MYFWGWLRRFVNAAFLACFTWYAFAVGNLSFLYSRNFLSSCIAWLMLAIGGTIALGLLLDTWHAVEDHDGPPDESAAFRTKVRGVLIRQLLLIGLLIGGFMLAHGWLTDRAVWLAGYLQRDVETRPGSLAPATIVGYWGVAGAIAAFLLNLTIWSWGTLDHIVFAFRLRGAIGCLRAMAGMAFLRTFGPLPDFFAHVPIFRNLAAFAMAGFLWADAPDRISGAIGATCLLVITLVYTASAIVPPTWLFLSASDYYYFEVFRILRYAWRPRNGITLLDRFGDAHLQTYLSERRILQNSGGAGAMLAGLYSTPQRPRGWSIRVRDRVWEPVLLALMRRTPLIVADIRGPGNLIVREVRTIVHCEWLEKTVLIGENAGDLSQLPDFVREEGGDLLASRVVTEDILREAVWSGNRLILPGIVIDTGLR